MSNCLVLGANGFLGSHLVDAIVDSGHNVKALDRFTDSSHNFLPSTKVKQVSGDFLNRNDLDQALKGIDYVFHFISTTTPITSENDPIIDIETNIRMSVELFEECVKHKVKKVIFASTGGAIYGDSSTDIPVSENTIPQPVSPYAIGKLTIEHYLRYFKRKHNLDSVTYRISNPYGERQSLVSKQGVIPIFLQHIAEGKPITILGDGSMVRDYIYVKDVASMISGSFKKASMPVYNLASGHGVSVNELVAIMSKIVSVPIKSQSQANLSTFVQKVVLDTSLFQNEFSISPKTELNEGIRKTWEYVLQNTGRG